MFKLTLSETEARLLEARKAWERAERDVYFATLIERVNAALEPVVDRIIAALEPIEDTIEDTSNDTGSGDQRA